MNATARRNVTPIVPGRKHELERPARRIRGGQRGHSRVAKAHKHLIQIEQSARSATRHQERGRFRQAHEGDDEERGPDEAAGEEHPLPWMAVQNRRGQQGAQDGSGGEAEDGGRDSKGPPPRIGEFRGKGIGQRHHHADADSGEGAALRPAPTPGARHPKTGSRSRSMPDRPKPLAAGPQYPQSETAPRRPRPCRRGCSPAPAPWWRARPPTPCPPLEPRRP